jgi:hypothetical protein
MGKPLSKVNRLEMLDLQRTRTRATQLTRAKDTPSKIHKRAFTASSSHLGVGRDTNGRLMGSGVIVNRAI